MRRGNTARKAAGKARAIANATKGTVRGQQLGKNKRRRKRGRPPETKAGRHAAASRIQAQQRGRAARAKRSAREPEAKGSKAGRRGNPTAKNGTVAAGLTAGDADGSAVLDFVREEMVASVHEHPDVLSAREDVQLQKDVVVKEEARATAGHSNKVAIRRSRRKLRDAEAELARKIGLHGDHADNSNANSEDDEVI